MKKLSPTLQQLPLDIVGSTTFGRYPKISLSQTFNMIISDDWLVPYAGHKKVVSIAQNGQGRGIHASNKSQQLILVIDDSVYTISKNLGMAKVGTLDTFDGDVFIDENNGKEIAICDKSNIYIFNYGNNTFQKAALDFIPGYVSFQDTYFIAPDLNSTEWRLSGNNDGLTWLRDAAHTGTFQTKADSPVAAVRIPGKGNLLFVFGKIVTEPWYDLGYQLFPYQRNSYDNIDYGTSNPATIATSDKFICWLGINEKSGPVIMYSTGGDPQQISNDGINFKLSKLAHPENAYGFLFKQDGHLIYQLTFPDPKDNLTLAFDFTTNKFFTLTDEHMNYHIAKRVVFFNNTYYFVAFNDGNLYELNTKYTTYDGAEIPRIRVCSHNRMPDSSRFVATNASFTLEQGEDSDLQAIDMSISKDGGQSFSNYSRKDLNAKGYRQNRLNWWDMGITNDLVAQFRFWGYGRFVATDGFVSVYQ